MISLSIRLRLALGHCWERGGPLQKWTPSRSSVDPVGTGRPPVSGEKRAERCWGRGSGNGSPRPPVAAARGMRTVSNTQGGLDRAPRGRRWRLWRGLESARRGASRPGSGSAQEPGCGVTVHQTQDLHAPERWEAARWEPARGIPSAPEAAMLTAASRGSRSRAAAPRPRGSQVLLFTADGQKEPRGHRAARSRVWKAGSWAPCSNREAWHPPWCEVKAEKQWSGWDVQLRLTRWVLGGGGPLGRGLGASECPSSFASPRHS